MLGYAVAWLHGQGSRLRLHRLAGLVSPLLPVMIEKDLSDSRRVSACFSDSLAKDALCATGDY